VITLIVYKDRPNLRLTTYRVGGGSAADRAPGAGS
jgi:hypothetical protein